MRFVPKNWHLRELNEEVVRSLSENLHFPESLIRVMVARGVRDEKTATEYLEKALHSMAGPFQLRGMERAAKRVVDALQSQEKVLVHGDFDADGISATALLQIFFREIHLSSFPFIPNRLKEGHGISPNAVELAIKENVSLVITCDCGISNVSEIAQLHESGIETIVTDHHRPPDNLPQSAILVDPHLEGNEQFLEGLSGVGVAFMLALAVRSVMRDRGLFKAFDEPNLKSYLDIVALGTLADMAPVVGQNRILVAHGLREMSASSRPGFVSMREQSGLSLDDSISATDVGFRLAPRINAAARLGRAMEALQLLTTDSLDEATRIASQVEDWNRQRRELEEKTTRLASVDATRQVEKGNCAIVVGGENFHPGIIGLVAQRLSSTWGVPAFVFSFEGKVARGSARARGGANIVKALEGCKDLLHTYGGHQEAAGCVLERDSFEAFQRAIRNEFSKQKVAAVHEVFIDAKLELGHLNRGYLSLLDQLRPFGVGNPEPSFWVRARVVGGAREVGKNHLKLRLRSPEGGASFSAIGFNMFETHGSRSKGMVEAVVMPELNSWNGNTEVQLRLHDIRPVSI